MHMRSGSVARIAGVDNDDRPSLSAELQAGSQTGGRAADDSDVAMTLDEARSMVTHVDNHMH